MFKFLVCDIRLWLFFESVWMILNRFLLSHLGFLIMQREWGSMLILHSWTAREVIILSKRVCLCNPTYFNVIFSACNPSCIKGFIRSSIFLNRSSFIFILLERNWSALNPDFFLCSSFTEMTFKTLHIRVLTLIVKACITWLWKHYYAVGTPSGEYLRGHSSLIGILRHTEFRSLFLITKQRFA